MDVEDIQRREDVRFVAISCVLCVLAAATEAIYEPETWVASDVWKSGELGVLHLLLAALSVASSLYWLTPPGLYGGVLAAPSMLLLAIATLATFAGLPHLLLWVLMLHHLPDVLLGLFRLARCRGPASSPAQQTLAGLSLVSLIPLWFLTRMYWYSQLLSPSLLNPLPNNVVAIGLVVHVLLWILAAINLRHYWRLVRFCGRYVSGGLLEELGEPFDYVPDNCAQPRKKADDTSDDRPRAQLSEHQNNMQLVYHTIMIMTRLKRKIRRRRAARQAAAQSAHASAGAAADGSCLPAGSSDPREAH